MSIKVRLLRKFRDGLIEKKFSTFSRSEGTTAIRGSLGSLGTEGPMMIDLRVYRRAVTLALKAGNLFVPGK